MNSDRIMVNPAELDNLCAGAETFNVSINNCVNEIGNAVETIKANWEGSEFEAAIVDLDNILRDIAVIKSNNSSIKSTVNEVNDKFKNLKYNGGAR